MITILLDLDGTLTDAGPGIIESFRHALERLGIDPPPVRDLAWIVGPPSRRSFPKFLGPEHDVEEAVRLYREHYASSGIFDAELYEGIPEALTQLRSLPARMLLCTAKPLPFARRVIEHFDLRSHFDALYGAELGGRFDDKGDLIAHILEVESIDPARTIMIGDREHDVRAATRHAIPCIGAVWGYGGARELSEAGATALCETPAQIPATVRDVMGLAQPLSTA